MPHDLQQKVFYGLLGLATAAALGFGLLQAGAEGLTFALFAALTLGGSAMCIWERSVVRSAFSLMATFSGIAGFFILLGHDFLAMAQLLIYVGGILALLLFGVMLTPPDLTERKLPRIGAATVLVGIGCLFLFGKVRGMVGSLAVVAAGDLTPPETRADDIGIAFMHPEQYVVAFELAAYLLTVALVASVYIARRRREDFEPEPETRA